MGSALNAVIGFVGDTKTEIDGLLGTFKKLTHGPDGVSALSAIGTMLTAGVKSVDWKGVGRTMADGLSGAVDFSKKLTPAIEKGIGAAASHVNGRKVLTGLVTGLSQAISALFSPSFWTKNFAAIFNLVTIAIPVAKILKIPGASFLFKWISAPFFAAVKMLAGGLFNLLKGAGSHAITGFLGGLEQMAPKTAHILLTVVTLSGKTLAKLPGRLAGFAGRAVSAVGSKLASGISTIAGVAGRWVGALIRPLESGVSRIGAAALALVKGAIAVLHGWGSRFVELGKNLILGMVSGIKSAASSVVDAVKSVASVAVDGVKGFLHIKSPSRVFHDIGRMVSLGFAEGIKAGASSVKDSLAVGLLYPVEGAIAKLEAEKEKLQAKFDAIDKVRERSSLLSALRDARTGSSGASSGSGSGSTTGGKDPLSWAMSKLGHYAENTGKNTGTELDKLQKQFGTRAAAWCAMFATTAAEMGGASKLVKTASVATAREWATAGTHGYEKGLKSKPKRGDLAAFGNDHMGMVESVDRKRGVIHTIEGNTTGGKVARRTHSIGSADYLRPKYSSPVSAVAASVKTSTSTKVSSALSKSQRAFVAELSGQTGLDPDVLAAWVRNEEGTRKKPLGHDDNNWLNVGWTDKGPVKGTKLKGWKSAAGAAKMTAQWMAGTGAMSKAWGPAASGIKRILGTKGKGAAAQMDAIGSSGWASGGEQLLRSLYSKSANGQHVATKANALAVIAAAKGENGTSAAAYAKTIAALQAQIAGLRSKARNLPTPAAGKAGAAQRKTNRAERKRIANQVAGLQQKVTDARSGEKTAKAGSSAKGQVADALKALKDFDREAARAKKLASIDLKVKGLDQLKAFKGAVADIRTQIADKLSTAVDNFRQKWEATIGATIDKSNAAALSALDRGNAATLDSYDKETEGMVAQSESAKQLAGMKAADDQKARDDEDKANQKALADAIAANDQQAISDAQAAIAATKRQRDETALEQKAADEETAIRAKRAADREALEAQQAAAHDALEAQQAADKQAREDAEVQSFKDAEQAKLDALTASLEAQKTSYQAFAQQVNAILAPLGLAFESSSEGEATINAGPTVAAPATAGSPPTAQSAAKPKHKKKKATGGWVWPGETYEVGEAGREHFTPAVAGRITQASEVARMGGRDAPAVHIEHAHFNTGNTDVFANKLAARLRRG
jgi:hypothetical protein